MNHNILDQICTQFNLGIPIESSTRVHGGLLHAMRKLDTDKGSYAIKQISKDIDLTNDKIIQNYNLTEEIASCFKELGIPAIAAITKLTIIDGAGFLVYPWVDAKSALKPSESQALKIAAILAKIHLIDLKIQEMAEAIFPTHEMQELPDILREANKAYQDAIPHLKQHLVVSHGDLDPKNVLWNVDNNPIIIDWESAKLINPTYEIINTSLDFCDIGNNFNQEQFIAMIKSYGALNKKDIKYAFGGILGNWINWLIFNIERSFSEDYSIKKLGELQVKQTINIILKLQDLIPQLEEKIFRI